MIASEAKGFIYIVSSMGVTGVRSEITTDIPGIVEAIRQVSDVPAAVGFGNQYSCSGRRNGKSI